MFAAYSTYYQYVSNNQLTGKVQAELNRHLLLLKAPGSNRLVTRSDIQHTSFSKGILRVGDL